MTEDVNDQEEQDKINALRAACLFGLVTQNYGQKVHIRRDALDPFLSETPPAVTMTLKPIDKDYYELAITESEPVIDVDIDVPF